MIFKDIWELNFNGWFFLIKVYIQQWKVDIIMSTFENFAQILCIGILLEYSVYIVYLTKNKVIDLHIM